MSDTSWPPDIPVFYPGTDAPTALNLMGQTLKSLLNPPIFRAERSSALTIATGHQFVAWNSIIEDTAGAWNAGSPSVYPAPASGWYQVHGTVSLSSSTAGATSLVLIAAVAVAGNSPIGTATTGQEGMEVFVPTGTTDPKVSEGDWFVYANIGDPIQLDLWYSTESSITAVDTTAGARCRIQIVGLGV